MPRVQPKSLSREELNDFFEEFWIMVASLETKDEVRNFFRDLLSETEALMLARRIRIAKLLLKGISYEDITKAIHASEGTIAQVHRWLQSGSGGYKVGLPRLEQILEKRMKTKEKEHEQMIPYSFAWLKRRYPLHFLLFNLFDRDNNDRPRKIKQ